jgi:hypothetical protein
MFDVFYVGPKPGLFTFEKSAQSLEQAAEQSRTAFFWFIHGANDYINFDFNWMPPPWEYQYTHTFPSQWHANGGVYFASKTHVDKNKLKFQHCQSVNRQVDMTNWQVPDNLDVSNFDFSWHPNPLEDSYEYHFPTQWQKDGGPVYRGTAGIKYVATQKAYTNATQIFYMDFMNPGSADQLADLRKQYPEIKSTRYVSDHLNVLKRIMNLAESKFVWIISSVCDYSDFDFTWHPEHWQEDMIHCFPSGKQKRGDTFYINVDSFKTQMYNLEMLDWFNVINYCSDQMADRILDPTVYYENDDLISVIKNYDFKFPYATFSNHQPTSIRHWQYHPCLWTEKDRSVESFTRSNSVCVVPRDVKAHLITQLYDYPYINAKDRAVFTEKKLDIIYISNGEPDEQRWYDELLSVTKKSAADIIWIRGVNGRANAYKAAAAASTTPWFFAVFAKLQVSSEFDWSWQPDYFQEPKHYIFNSRNAVNGLEYGHQGMIAYNRRLVLETVDSGLDFTLSKAHEVVPILSGVAHFNQNPWMTWRTAFREVIKLKQFQSETPTVETAHRLKVWLTKAEGLHSEWCLRGAADAVEYYDSVEGDFNKLMLSYEWNWLQIYYDSKYPIR